MTRFAEPTIIRCPSCNWHLRQSRLASINFHGRTIQVWTDGVTSIGYEIVSSPLLQCPLCNNPFWKQDAKEVDIPQPEPQEKQGRLARILATLTGKKKKEEKKPVETNWLGVPNDVAHAVESQVPTIGDWLTILNGSTSLSPERESIVRQKIWQEGNDHLRIRSDGTPCRKTPLFSNEFSNQNLLALLDLHKNNLIDSPTEKAEILRQLGRFDEALQVLETLKEEGLNRISTRIWELAAKHDGSLQSLN